MTSDISAKLVVFDLDFTLWDCGGTWCDCLRPPFEFDEGRVVDSNRRWVRLYDDVLEILDRCDQQGVPMALASRTEQPEWAQRLLDMLEITHRFAFSEIYPSSKRKHFNALGQDSSVAFSEMLFFDDEMRNIREVSQLGVKCIHVQHGMTWGVFNEQCSKQ